MKSSDAIGKDAYTKITLLKSFRSYSYVQVEIETEEHIKLGHIQRL